MKVLLLAAGRSKRLNPVGDKNFLDFCGKSLLQRQVEQLLGAGFKDIVIAGGRHNLARIKRLAADFLRSARYLNVKVVEQKNLDDGMAGAVLSAGRLLGRNPVFIVSANDVVDESAYRMIRQAAPDKKFDTYIIGKEVAEYFPGGYLKVGAGGLIKGIVEKPGAGKEPGRMVNLVLHFHRDAAKLVKELRETGSANDDRYEVALDRLIKAGVKMKALHYDGFWQAVKYPWHILTLMNRIMACEGTGERKCRPAVKGLKKGKNVTIAKSASIKGNVYLADGVRVLENAVISGPAYIGKNTVIATGALVRCSQIGDDCVIGFGSEVARSYLGNNVWTHTNYIGDSVIGNNCSFGAGTVTGNLRLDEEHVRVNIRCGNGGVNGDCDGDCEKISSGTNKFGLVTGDNVRCGINASFMPGVKIGNNCFIGAGITVAQDIPDNKFVYGKTELVMKDNVAKTDLKKREGMKNKLNKLKVKS